MPRRAHSDLRESQLSYYESVLDSTALLLHSLRTSLTRTGCADAAREVGRAINALEEAWAAISKEHVQAIVNLEQPPPSWLERDTRD
jgi:hypothetical protein